MTDSIEYIVKQGDCLLNIATRFGHLPETIWNHPNNKALKDQDRAENLLLPGDVVIIPPLVEEEAPCDTEKRHRFVRKATDLVFRVKICEFDEPAAETSYQLKVGSTTFNGETDADGLIEQPIPSSSRQAHLLLEEIGVEYDIQIGGLDPVTEPQGIQGRLNNLGHYCGKEDGDIGTRTEAALRLFQAEMELEVTGDVNEETETALLEKHGS